MQFIAVQELKQVLHTLIVNFVKFFTIKVLGGLLHCSFLPATGDLLKLFMKKCKTKIPKSSSRRALSYTSLPAALNPINASVIDKQEADSMRTRHMGVLGLCAFISAYPYDIPDFVPDVFDHLGAHLNDPQPIAVSRLISLYFKPFNF